MSQQIISFAKLEPTVGQPAETFELNMDGRFVWLQRACFWLLDRLDARSPNKLYVKRVVVDPERLLKYIRTQWVAVRQETGKSATRVFMGPEEFDQICHELVDSYTVFEMMHPGAPATVFGMKIEIVPWMKGVLVLP